jgi:branched-chain amino acid transport system substrate-binding protein
LLAGVAALAVTTPFVIAAGQTRADDPIRVGLSLPMTGDFAENGTQILSGTKLFLEQHGGSVAGRKVELVVRDDAGLPDQAKRIAQQLIVENKVVALAGYNPTPNALAVAPIATEAKIPEIVMGSSTSVTTEKSPYIVRTLSTQAQITVPIADWAAKHQIKRVFTLVSDFAPGIETEKAFIDEFKRSGGEIVDALRMPLESTNYVPYLQRAKDAKPDALFVWVPGGLSGRMLRQFVELGLNDAGVKLIGTGDITDDAILNQIGDPVLGTITTLQYSDAHPSAANKAFVESFKRVSNGVRPDHIGVAAYDGMHLLFDALEKTGGNTNGDALIAAMKGDSWESPRGPVTIDPQTREMVQDVYVRRVERVEGELYNVEFEKFDAVKDPSKTAQKN